MVNIFFQNLVRGILKKDTIIYKYYNKKGAAIVQYLFKLLLISICYQVILSIFEKVIEPPSSKVIVPSESSDNTISPEVSSVD